MTNGWWTANHAPKEVYTAWHANVLTLDICTVAYWYQSEPHAPFLALRPKEQR